MDNGADPMIPNNDHKESAFHYCGKSGNSEVTYLCFAVLSNCKYLFFYFVGCKRDHKTFACRADSAGG